MRIRYRLNTIEEEYCILALIRMIREDNSGEIPDEDIIWILGPEWEVRSQEDPEKWYLVNIDPNYDGPPCTCADCTKLFSKGIHVPCKHHIVARRKAMRLGLLYPILTINA